MLFQNLGSVGRSETKGKKGGDAKPRDSVSSLNNRCENQDGLQNDPGSELVSLISRLGKYFKRHGLSSSSGYFGNVPINSKL